MDRVWDTCKYPPKPFVTLCHIRIIKGRGRKMVGHAPLGVTELFGRGNEGLWENVYSTLGKPTFFRIYGSPDGTDIMTVSPGEIAAQSGSVWQEVAGSCSGSFASSVHAHSKYELISWCTGCSG